MPKISVDGVEYNTEDLSQNGRNLLTSLQYVEAQVKKLKEEIQIYSEARASYSIKLKNELEKAQ